MRAGIIGGTGRMGGFFRSVFERAGWDVICSGSRGPPGNREIVEQSDLVMVSVPIRKTVGVIREIAPFLHKEQVLCDVTSLKVEPVRAMLASRAQVIGLHPMFGPGVGSLKNQTIIATPARCDAGVLERLLGIFRDQGACITISTPEDHDAMMAVIQGLIHFGTLCSAETIRRLNVDVERTLAFTSPIYRIQICLIGRLLAQDPGLYGDMLQLNPAVPEVLGVFLDAAESLKKIVEAGDPASFEEFFTRNTGHYRDYLETATEETDGLIRYMVER
ncbi:prephenate and/or arogenate dehydrogenase (unknown specificity) [hydrocarbon metagenome]|uniref:Prephenate/arogenate dehydrogenase domain-containing protein n=1 Tax=hydrocarbon metagenome TaxID=938273 RepID=A0A0W8FIE3_9ZZZZ|nr:prephenate dehydrogenase/arogenate dehydrogenase family protein [Methanomicrobiaceae archaeon]